MSYISRSGRIDNNQIQIERAFIKEEERDNNTGNLLHTLVYTNGKDYMEKILPVLDVNAVNENDRTPLHLAVKYGRKEMVEMLLDKGAKVDVVDNRNRTPLHLAAQYNEKKEIVEMLLNKGAKVDVVDNRDRTPLHYATKNGHMEIVKELLKVKGIDVNAKDEDGKTPLDFTTNKEIKTLLKKAAEKTDDVNPAGEILSDSEGDQEEDAEKEKQEGDAQSGSDITNQEADKTVNSGSGTPQAQQGTASSGQETQTEEQISSFFYNLFSVLIKPFSLAISFFSNFFLWLFDFNKEKADELTLHSDLDVSSLTSNISDDENYDTLDTGF